MRIVAIIICLWSVPVYALTVNEHAADSSNPHGAKMKITEKLNVGTGDDYAAGYALRVEGGATIDSLNLGGGNLTFGTASSTNGSLSIGTTTAGSSRIKVIGTVTATTFVGDGTFLTGVGAGTGSGNWTDTGSSTQTLYPDTVTRKVAVGTTTTNNNQFAVDGTARVYGTFTATKLIGDGSLLTGISAGDGTETIWVNNGSTTSQGTITQNIVLGSTTAAANQKLTVVGSSTFRDTYIGGVLSIGTGGSSLIGGTPTINLAIGDSDSGFRHISDGIYAAVGNGDDQIVIDGTADKVYIGTSTGDTKLFVKGDIKATGTITAAFFSGNGAGITGINDAEWTDTGEALQPGTITYKLRLGTATANGATLQVEGSATVGGTLSATVVIANAPDGQTEDAIANSGQLASIKAEMLTEIIDHIVATSDIHGVGESTIASMAAVATVSAYAITQYGSLNNTSFGSSSTTSSFTVEADSIKLIDASNHALIVTGVSVTNTITTAGPTVGGRDQAAAFGAEDWIYFYWIHGTTTSSISSLSYPAPSALPAGYTHWCLAAIVKSSGSALKTGYMRGNIFHYEGRQTVVTGQTNTTESTISLSSFIPPEAIDWIGELELGITNSVPSTSQARYNLRLATNVNYCRPLVNTDAPGLSNWQSQFVLVPNMNQSIITRWTDDNGNTLSGNIYLNSYSIPNGGM